MPVSVDGVFTELFILKVYSYMKLYQIQVNGQVLHLRKTPGKTHNKWTPIANEISIVKKEMFLMFN